MLISGIIIDGKESSFENEIRKKIGKRVVAFNIYYFNCKKKKRRRKNR